MNKKTATITILAATCISTVANADVFTDSASFDAANLGLALIDFEGFANPGDFTGNADGFFAGQGVMFSTPNNPGSNTVIAGTGGNANFFTSVLLGGFGDSILMDFTTPVTAVGFNVSAMDFGAPAPFFADVTIEVFNGNTLLATEIFGTAPFSDFSSYIGFSNLGSEITSVLVTPTGTSFVNTAIDNLSFNVVPTPGSLAVMSLGLFCASGRRRS